MANFVFKEVQRFNQWWLWVPFLVMSAGFHYLLIAHLLKITAVEGKVFTPLVLSIVLINLITILLFVMKLSTRIDERSVAFKYFPFINKWRKYSIEEIDEIEFITYNSLMQLGGWGIRFVGNKWIYNVRGNHGIRIKTAKKHIIIGTQKSKEAQRIVNQIKEKLAKNYAQ